MTQQFTPDDRGRPQAQGPGAPAFLWGLVGIMAAIEFALSLSEAGYLGSFNWRWPAFAAGAFWQPIFTGTMTPLYPGQRLVMLVTYAFLHGGILHLAINSVILLALGKFAASHIGAARTLLLLFLSAVGGGLAYGLLSQSAGPMIGASGAVFGLIGLWQGWDYRMRKNAGLPLRPVITGILGLAAANLVLFVIFSGGLAWEAHLGGWLVGWVMALRQTVRNAKI
ncbi:MAG: rhomboid family intramembrane serine protease [Roseovarius sp.]|uniref:rhomboid family intramembrane serine protease n=1 Tax=Roseovarius sp. TaxID=1486281 RepID=UPI0032ED91B0